MMFLDLVHRHSVAATGLDLYNIKTSLSIFVTPDLVFGIGKRRY